ncbi:MAG TPA: MerR family transcriptional regulator [Propionibacteriaceae bacterium]
MQENAERRRVMPIGEVAALFQVTRESVRHWAAKGLIPSFRTPGGTLRFYADEIEPMAASTTSRTEAG